MSLKNNNQPQKTAWMTNEVTAPNKYSTDEEETEIPEKDRKTHVNPYKERAEFPLEKGDVVWIVKPEYRAPLGEFRITKAHPNDKYELVRCSDNILHCDLVEGKHLCRNI
ncbi:hypothetical protein P7C71_g2193, partial [Lecanoromycetidae sp. Uapishka_2]